MSESKKSGGKRKTRSQWQTPTTTIRVPLHLAKNLVKIAIKLELLSETELETAVKHFLDPPSPNEVATNSNNTVLPANLQAKSSQNLTEDQERAIEKLKSFILGSDFLFRLTGYAGTGKSFLICYLLQWLKSKKIDFVVVAPTNKAAKNLAKLSAGLGLFAEAITIAKLLGQQPQINKETGKEEFISAEYIELPPVVIIDEFSMVGQNTFFKLVQEAKISNSKIIFVGDAAQLPPVGEKQSYIETATEIKSSFELNEVVRYEGEIARVAEEIRSNNAYNFRVFPFVTTVDETIRLLGKREWLKEAARYFNSPEFQEDPDYCRILVWRNRNADSLNSWIRSCLWGQNPPLFCVGDRLIAKKPVFRPSANFSGKSKIQWNIIMNNSEECEIIDNFRLDKSRSLGWSYWTVPVKTDDGIELELRILTKEGEAERQAAIETASKMKDWKQVTIYNKSFDTIAFAYALTTHKAQGSSIDYTFMDLQDMRHCPDKQRIQYTALTRAKKQAIVLGR